jgi:hypothetical protein
MKKAFGRNLMWPSMTALFKIVFLSGVLLLFSTQARATKVGNRADHCPFCHHDYLVHVLLSYNNFSGYEGPPKMPPSSCPFCLAVWIGDPPKELTKEQRQALKAALESWPNDLSPSDRQNLLRELDERYTADLRERIGAALQARCAAALRGERLPGFVVEPKRFAKESRDQDKKDHKTFLKELPRLIQAQKEGREAVIQPESKWVSKDIVTLHQAQRAIVNGDPLAFEYFVRWAVAVDDASVLEEGRADGSVFGNILFDVARCKKLPWPEGVDLGKARSSFAAACLRYAFEPDRQLDRPLREVITNSTPLTRAALKSQAAFGKEKAPGRRLSARERARIALKAAAGKKDRAATRLIPFLAPSQLDTYGDAFPLYYQSVGKPEDLPFLEKCATYAMDQFKSAKTRGRDVGWPEDPLAAYGITRLKCQLRGEAVPFDFAE